MVGPMAPAGRGCQMEYEGGVTGSVDRVAGGNHDRQVDHFLPCRRPIPVMLKKCFPTAARDA